ncbi:MAG: efflux RND transporter periplasmic adaptor subunit [Alphaproteobacteria bacterium]|nr:efflux RND transporter periplasmic adaptor subunit [Alphaproteobacteria bacterium]
MTRKKKYIIFGVAAVLVIGFILTKAKTPQNMRDMANLPTPVNIAKVVREDVPVTVIAPGNLVAANTVTVRSRVDGQLTRILFNEGQVVQKNQVLAHIDPRPFDAALQQSVANLHNSEAQLVKAKADLVRSRDLAKEGFISKQTLEAAELAVTQLEATRELNQAAIAAAKTQRDYADIRAPISGRTGVRQIDEGNIIRAGDALGLVMITQAQPIVAVFSLTEQQLPQLIARLKREQAVKSPAKSKPAAKLSKDEFDISYDGTDESDSDSDSIGQNQPIRAVPHLSSPIAVTAWDKSGTIKMGEGRVTLIDNIIDSVTGTIKLKAEFANKDQLLWPGQYVMIRLVIDTLNEVLTVPEQAVQQGADGPYVFVVGPVVEKSEESVAKTSSEMSFSERLAAWRKKSESPLGGEHKPDAAVMAVKLRQVTVLWRENGRAVLAKGVNEGESIVTEGQYRLRDGSKISVLESQAATPAAAAENKDANARNGEKHR